MHFPVRNGLRKKNRKKKKKKIFTQFQEAKK